MPGPCKIILLTRLVHKEENIKHQGRLLFRLSICYLFSQENLYYHEQLIALLENEDEGPPLGLKVNIGSDENKEKKKNEFFKPDNRGFVNSLFIESLDILVMSSQDGKICKSMLEICFTTSNLVNYASLQSAADCPLVGWHGFSCIFYTHPNLYAHSQDQCLLIY